MSRVCYIYMAAPSSTVDNLYNVTFRSGMYVILLTRVTIATRFP